MHLNVTKIADGDAATIQDIIDEPAQFACRVTDVVTGQVKGDESVAWWMTRKGFSEVLRGILTYHDGLSDHEKWQSLARIYASMEDVAQYYEAMPLHQEALQTLREMMGAVILSHYADEYNTSGTARYLRSSQASVAEEGFLDNFTFQASKEGGWLDQLIESVADLPKHEEYDAVGLFLNEMVKKCGVKAQLDSGLTAG